MMENENTIALFKEKFENLEGHVHLASNPDELYRIITSILLEASVKNTVLAGLDDETAAVIEKERIENNIEVTRPPFDSPDIPKYISGFDAGVCMARAAIAETGSLVEITTDDSIRICSALPMIYIGIVHEENIIERLPDSAPLLKSVLTENQENIAVTFINGPSRTADIEMRLTLGIHGPQITHAIILKGAQQ